MLDAIGAELPQVFRDLAIAGFAFLAYDLARRSTIEHGTASTLLKGALWCAGLALLAAFLLGQGSCEGGDRMFGSCDDMEGGYTPPLAARAAQFAYWFLLLGVPACMGAFNDRARLKAEMRKPDAS